MDNKINSFTFYRDYYFLIDTLPLKDKTEILLAIVDYMFKDKEPNLIGHNQAIFNTLKYQLNTSKNNSKRKTKKEPEENRKETGEEPNNNQIETEEEPKENKTSVLSFIFYISNNCLEKREYEGEKPLLNELDSLFNEYIELRRKNKMVISDTVLNRLWNKLKPYDDETKKEMLGNAINGKWKDLYPLDPTKVEKLPKWFDEDIQDEILTEEELKEFRNSLRKGENDS